LAAETAQLLAKEQEHTHEQEETVTKEHEQKWVEADAAE